MKKYLFIFVFIFLIINALLFPAIALDAAKCGLSLWFEQILPSLLPFTILSGIFLRSKWLDAISTKGSGLPVSIIMGCGMVFGFPIGAKLSGEFYSQGYIGKSQAEILSVCTNNFSPMFINGFVVPLLFGINTIIYPVFILLYGIPLLIGIVLLNITFKSENTQYIETNNLQGADLICVETKPDEYPCMKTVKNNHLTPMSVSTESQKKSASRFQLDMQIIDAGIISGFETLIKICGYIVLFSMLTSFAIIYVKDLTLPTLCILGNLEINNGLTLLSGYDTSSLTKFILGIQFLSFGGISGMAQSASFLSSSGLSVTKYILGKIMLSGILTGIAVILPIIIPYQR